MALIKENNDYGLTVSYWRIDNIAICRGNKECFVVVNLYANKEAKKNIDTRQYIISNHEKVTTTYDRETGEEIVSKELINDFDEYVEYFLQGEVEYRDVYNSCYEYLKNKIDFFSDAEDDEEEIIREQKEEVSDEESVKEEEIETSQQPPSLKARGL